MIPECYAVLRHYAAALTLRRRYLVTTLKFVEAAVTLAFSATSVTSPILGVILGGLVRRALLRIHRCSSEACLPAGNMQRPAGSMRRAAHPLDQAQSQIAVAALRI